MSAANSSEEVPGDSFLARTSTNARSNDPEIAAQHLATLHAGRHRPRLVQPGDPEFVLTRVDIGGLSTNLMRHAGRAVVTTAPLDDLFAERRMSGSAVAAGGSARFRLRANTPMMMPTDVELEFRWDYLETRFVGIPRWVLDDAARNRGIEPVRLVGLRPVSPAHDRYWSSLLELTHRELTAPDSALVHPLVLENLLRTLGNAALAAFPSSADTDAPAAGAAEPAVVRRAIDYIDANADRPIGVADIATAAHIGVRGLQQAFRRHRGQSPLDCLRAARLERAHRGLVAADPAHASVQLVARRWGFSNPGRFASYYRDAYGQPPNETLAR